MRNDPDVKRAAEHRRSRESRGEGNEGLRMPDTSGATPHPAAFALHGFLFQFSLGVPSGNILPRKIEQSDCSTGLCSICSGWCEHGDAVLGHPVDKVRSDAREEIDRAKT